jgi:hypothetical protein
MLSVITLNVFYHALNIINLRPFLGGLLSFPSAGQAADKCAASAMSIVRLLGVQDSQTPVPFGPLSNQQCVDVPLVIDLAPLQISSQSLMAVQCRLHRRIHSRHDGMWNAAGDEYPRNRRGHSFVRSVRLGRIPARLCHGLPKRFPERRRIDGADERVHDAHRSIDPKCRMHARIHLPNHHRGTALGPAAGLTLLALLRGSSPRTTGRAQPGRPAIPPCSV